MIHTYIHIFYKNGCKNTYHNAAKNKYQNSLEKEAEKITMNEEDCLVYLDLQFS